MIRRFKIWLASQLGEPVLGEIRRTGRTSWRLDRIEISQSIDTSRGMLVLSYRDQGAYEAAAVFDPRTAHPNAPWHYNREVDE